MKTTRHAHSYDAELLWGEYYTRFKVILSPHHQIGVDPDEEHKCLHGCQVLWYLKDDYLLDFFALSRLFFNLLKWLYILQGLKSGDHYTWPQFIWVKEVSNTDSAQWDPSLCFDEVFYMTTNQKV